MSKQAGIKFVILIAAIFLLVLVPAAVSRPNQADTRAVALGIGIDKAGAEYEVSLQIVQPSTGLTYTDNFLTISRKAQTVPQCLEMISINLGKHIGLDHCKLIIVSDAVCNENLIQVLDYFLRAPLLNTNVALINTPTSAKDALEASAQGINAQINSASKIMQFNEKYISAGENKLLGFLKDYLRPASSSFIASVTVKEKDAESGESAGGSGSEGGGQGSGSGQSKEKELVNDGVVSIFKKGKKAAVLTSDEVRGLNWLEPGSIKGTVQIEDVTAADLTNAVIIADIQDKSVRYSVQFVNGLPVINYIINVTLDITEISNINGNIAAAPRNSYLNQTVKNKFADKINQEIIKVQTKIKTTNVDAINFYDKFNKLKSKEWKNYLAGLTDPADYLQNITVFTKIIITAKS